MNATRRNQTKAREYMRGLRLVGSGVLSPYFQMIDTRKVGPIRNIHLFLAYMAVNKAIMANYQQDNPGAFSVLVSFIDGSTNLVVDNELLDLTIPSITDLASLDAAAMAAYNAYIIAAGYTITTFIKATSLVVPPAPSLYQTIVSQTGTTAPAVSGSLSPLNTYAGAPTFAWARTSAGVYTLTASAAVFSTAGKTSVLVGPLNNLNGAVTAVITSSTVITFTFAVQSLAVLGLLGFTATPTDALLTKTAIQVLTYA